MNDYKEEYKSPYSNLQFSTICKLSKKNNIDTLSRLMTLIMKRFNNELHDNVYSILTKNTTDDIIYKELYILYNSYNNKIHKYTKRPNKNCDIVKILVCYLRYFMKFDLVKKSVLNYLDVGAGNGKFCKMFGKELKIENKNIYGIDLPSFSEQGDWNRHEITNDIEFKTINKNDKYPFEDNKFDIITMKMVFHHIENIELSLSEISRVLCNDGYLIIIEHDVQNYLDYILCEIEHFFYIKVFNKNYTYRKIYKKHNYVQNIKETKENIQETMKKDISELGYVKFRNLEETNQIFSQFGFNELQTDFLYENNIIERNNISPTRNYWTIYQLNK